MNTNLRQTLYAARWLEIVYRKITEMLSSVRCKRCENSLKNENNQKGVKKTEYFANSFCSDLNFKEKEDILANFCNE